MPQASHLAEEARWNTDRSEDYPRICTLHPRVGTELWSQPHIQKRLVTGRRLNYASFHGAIKPHRGQDDVCVIVGVEERGEVERFNQLR